MSKAKTDEKFKEKLQERRPDIIPLEVYKGHHIKIKVKNIKCNHEYLASPSSLFSGRNCPECASNHLISPHKMALRIMKEFNGKLSLYEDTYVNTNTKTKLKCNDCGFIFWTRINALLRNKRRGKGNNIGCPKCSHRMTPEYEEVKKELDSLYDGTITFSKDDYKLVNKKLKFHCSKGNHDFVSTVGRVVTLRSGCPLCKLHCMETPVIEALTAKKVDFDHDCSLEGSNYNGSSYPLRADFRFKKYPIIIETDGQQHFKPNVGGRDDLNYTIERDLHKNKWCKEHGYILIRVTSSPTHEWGTEKHITLKELLDLIENYIAEDGVVNVEEFKKYDFNKE